MQDVRCPECARVLGAEDCYCDGSVCTQCGKVVRGMRCIGNCYDQCRDSVEQRNGQVQWLSAQRRRAAIAKLDPNDKRRIVCPWLPCGGADCATWGVHPDTCDRSEALELGFSLYFD